MLGSPRICKPWAASRFGPYARSATSPRSCATANGPEREGVVVMPIRAIDRARYPANWKAIRAEVLKRAQNRCEGSPRYPDCRAENGQPHPVTGSRVILTIGHL